MAVDDRRKGPANATKASGDPNGVIRLTNVVDCAADDVASGDVVQLFLVPAGYGILGASAHVLTVEGGTLTFDVGLHLESNDAEVDKDGFLDGVDGNAAGVKVTSAEAYANDLVWITAGTNVTATFNNAADKAKIAFCVWLLEGFVS